VTSGMDLSSLLRRSDEFDAALIAALGADQYRVADGSMKVKAAFAAAHLSIDHARAFRVLIDQEYLVSATGMLRLQFESLVRAVWIFFAASDETIDMLMTPIQSGHVESPKEVPMAPGMLKELESKAPAKILQMLKQFKDVSWNPLNSFVHSGIHPLQRRLSGYPEPLVIQLVVMSNGLLLLVGMVFAVLSGRQELTRRVGGLQALFSDSLPIIDR
jgi:hypothetical protein